MIISLIILGLLLLNIYRGFQDGLVYEFVRIISYLVGWLIAIRFAHPLGSVINQYLCLDKLLVNGLSFLIILVIAVMVLKSLGRAINHVTDFPIIRQLNAVGGAVVGALVGYLIVFILLNVGLALPSAWLQNEYTNSPVALKIVNHTPGIANRVMNNWLR